MLLSHLKNVLIESHGLLSGIDYVAYSFNKPLNLCWIQMKMGVVYDMYVWMLHHSLSSISQYQLFYFSYKTFISRILLMNLLKTINLLDMLIRKTRVIHDTYIYSCALKWQLYLTVNRLHVKIRRYVSRIIWYSMIYLLIK